MKCHYEVLEVERDADDDTIKKAYKKMALKWHPDKNPEKIEECTQVFALLQQAYEVLSDRHEREWYDRHRESILRGGFDEHYKDESLNLFPYFTSSCYKGFGKDAKGFYTTYSHVFETLAQEDYDFLDDQGVQYPRFGDECSDYESIVGPFYGFWTSFSTARSFAWLDEYDIRQAPNRPTMRAMEKENKKLREAGRKQRSEQIRELAAFVRKRDPRVAKYKTVLEEKKKESELKAEENRRNQIKKQLAEANNYVESDEARTARLAHLEEIEQQLNEQFGGESSLSDEDAEDNGLYCVVCEKSFKTRNAKQNHEKSKNHRQALAELKKYMKEEDSKLFADDDEVERNSDSEGEPAELSQQASGKKSKRSKKNARRARKEQAAEEDSENEDSAEKPVGESVEKVAEEMETLIIVDEPEPLDRKKAAKAEKKAAAKNKQIPAQPEAEAGGPIDPKPAKCDKCGEWFESRSRLFAHLKETGHATLKMPGQAAGQKNKKGKR